MSRRIPLFVCLFVGFLGLLGLRQYHLVRTESIQTEWLEKLPPIHDRVSALFDSSFFFFFDDQFVPGIIETLKSGAPLKRIRIVKESGLVLYDSNDPKKRQSDSKLEDLGTVAESPSQATLEWKWGSGRSIVAGNQVRILYDISTVAHGVWLVVLGALVLAIAWLSYWAAQQWVRGPLKYRVKRLSERLLGLRGKFIAAVLSVNLATGAIIFFTLTMLQTREQTGRIERDAILFAQYSSTKVIEDFEKYFYFYYQERFIPTIKGLTGANPNLISVRIVSLNTKAVLFDSEVLLPGLPVAGGAQSRTDYSDDVILQLKGKGFHVRPAIHGREKALLIVQGAVNEGRQLAYAVEYLYGFHSLSESVAAIRRQILIDLLPSFALGLLVSILVAQLVLGPVRKLASALQRVTEGDYGVSIAEERGDELGQLIRAFNTMTSELRKKKELRKYLSDSTYQRIMSNPENARIRGQRMQATVLFCDIRNFVEHCEHMDAEEITDMLNDYFTKMVEVVTRNGGEIDKFIGDAFLAVFHSPVEEREAGARQSAFRAVYAALEMQRRLGDLNETRAERGQRPLQIGVGMSFGDVIYGPIGAEDRRDFTVIGDVVNLASRIEKLSKKGRHTKIVLSNHVEGLVRDYLITEEMAEEPIRGKTEAVRVFELVGIRDVRVLEEGLGSDDVETRLRSAEMLGYSKNRDALKRLIGTLKDSDARVRIQVALAIGALASTDDPEALDALFDRVARESSLKVLSTLITAIGKLCTTERVLSLSSYLEHTDERIVSNCIEAMAQARSPKAVDLLLPKLTSGNNRVKANAALALFAAGHYEVLSMLKPMLLHSDPLMRSSAAFAIGELPQVANKERIVEAFRKDERRFKWYLAQLQECVPLLVSLLRDSELMVKKQAVLALGKIRDRSAVLPILEAVQSQGEAKEYLRAASDALREIGAHRVIRDVVDRMSS